MSREKKPRERLSDEAVVYLIAIFLAIFFSFSLGMLGSME